MKKLTGWLLLLMIWFTACEGPMGPAGPPGMDGESTQWFIADCTVYSEDWIPARDDLMGDYFEYEFRIDALTSFVFNEGAVVCYLEQNVTYGGRVTAVQTPIPYTFYGEASGGVLYSENYTYEVRTGYINFIVKISDFDTQTQQPLDCKFRVVLMW